MLQYIGARYVPVFYQNSLDPTSSDWEVNVTYEPMTWVSMSNGHMYISKKEVPANIGSPASNPDYWLEAGQYNAYIQSLQDQIDDMKDGTVPGSLQDQINDIVNTDLPAITGDITNLQGDVGDLQTDVGNLRGQRRKIILIGDSYLSGGLGFDTYGTKLAALMPSDSIYQYSEAGAGFVHLGGNNKNFETLLDEAITAHTTDADEITDVIAIGGSNDDQQTDTAISNKLAAFSAKVRTNFVNARCYIGFFAWTNMSIGSSGKLQFTRTQEQYWRLGALNKMLYINGLENFGHVYDEFYNAGHPSEACHDKVASFLLDYLKSGSGELIELEVSTFTPATGFTADAYIGGVSIIARRKSNVTEIYMNGRYTLNSWGAFGYTFAAGTIPSAGGLISLGTLSGGLVYGVDATSFGVGYVSQNCTAWFGTGSSWTAVPGTIAITNGQLLFAPAQAFTDFSGFNVIRLPATKLIMNTLYC